MDPRPRVLATFAALGLAAAFGAPDDKAFATITEADVAAHLTHIAAPELEGRDSPSVGLSRAADYLEERMRALGLEPVVPEQESRPASFRLPFRMEREVPLATDCAFEYRREADAPAESFALNEDFVPLPICEGRAEGTLVFAGFGITGTRERYDDLARLDVKGRVALILEGEPRHRRLFEGAEVTDAADVHGKIEALVEEGAVGVLVVRRSPAVPTQAADEAVFAPARLGYRYTWAHWNDGRSMPNFDRRPGVPALEISEFAASRLLGEDVAAVAAKIDKSGKPASRELDQVFVSMRSAFERRDVEIDNVAGIVRGSDPDLANEYVVLGAHYDHIGVDPWGRIGFGADDNGSGTVALLELAEALVLDRPRRSVLFAWFAAEEDGLIGSRAFCDAPPVPRDSMVAMFNMDMLGRGDAGEIYVIGVRENPGFEDTLKDAKKLHATKIKKVVIGKGRGFWERSDHHSFHAIGVPVLFFFENYPESENPDYHTYRDTIESLDLDKVTRSTRFLYNMTWLVANADERPPAPR